MTRIVFVHFRDSFYRVHVLDADGPVILGPAMPPPEGARLVAAPSSYARAMAVAADWAERPPEMAA